jgi:hypothetical protein
VGLAPADVSARAPPRRTWHCSKETRTLGGHCVRRWSPAVAGLHQSAVPARQGAFLFDRGSGSNDDQGFVCRSLVDGAGLATGFPSATVACHRLTTCPDDLPYSVPRLTCLCRVTVSGMVAKMAQAAGCTGSSGIATSRSTAEPKNSMTICDVVGAADTIRDNRRLVGLMSIGGDVG